VLAEQVNGHIILHNVTEENESDVPADLKRLVGACRNSNIEIKISSVAEQITSMAGEHDLLITRALERSQGVV